jgi:hypothetical protein
MGAQKKPTNWHAKISAAKAPHVVVLESDFAGVKAGKTMLISSPLDIAAYVSRIPHGETRTMVRMRSDMSKKADADAMCPVTASIFLKVVAEAALVDIAKGEDMGTVPPFWRIIEPTSKLAEKLSCGRDGIEHLLRLDGYTVLES